jgi:hypothetical protein
MNAPAVKFDFGQVTTARDEGPQLFLLYSEEKWGKTTFVCDIPNLFIVCPEDGLKGIERPAAHFPRSPRNLPEFYEALDAFERGNVRDGQTGQRPFRHLAIDSASWLETMFNQASRADIKSRNLGSDFQSGHKIVDSRWDEFVERILLLRRRNGVHLWLIAHADKTKEATIDGSTFDKYDLRLDRKAAALLRRSADHVFFGAYRSEVVKGGKGKRAVGRYTGRVLYTRSSAHHFAGSRSSVPEILNATWADLLAALKAGAPAPGAKMRADIEAIASSLSDEDRAVITADLAAAKTDRELMRVLSRAEGFAALAEQEDGEDGDAAAAEHSAEGQQEEEAPKTPAAPVPTAKPTPAAKPANSPAPARAPMPAARQQDEDDEDTTPAPLDGQPGEPAPGSGPRAATGAPPSAPPARGSDPGSAPQPAGDPEAAAAVIVAGATDLEGISKGLASIVRLTGLSDQSKDRHMQALKDKRANLLAKGAR